MVSMKKAPGNENPAETNPPVTSNQTGTKVLQCQT